MVLLTGSDSGVVDMVCCLRSGSSPLVSAAQMVLAPIDFARKYPAQVDTAALIQVI